MQLRIRTIYILQWYPCYNNAASWSTDVFFGFGFKALNVRPWQGRKRALVSDFMTKYLESRVVLLPVVGSVESIPRIALRVVGRGVRQRHGAWRLKELHAKTLTGVTGDVAVE